MPKAKAPAKKDLQRRVIKRGEMWVRNPQTGIKELKRAGEEVFLSKRNCEIFAQCFQAEVSMEEAAEIVEEATAKGEAVDLAELAKGNPPADKG